MILKFNAIWQLFWIPDHENCSIVFQGKKNSFYDIHQVVHLIDSPELNVYLVLAVPIFKESIEQQVTSHVDNLIEVVLSDLLPHLPNQVDLIYSEHLVVHNLRWQIHVILKVVCLWVEWMLSWVLA